MGLFGVGAAVLLPERFAVNGPMLHMLFGLGGLDLHEDEVLSRLRVPPGLHVARFASELPGARMLAFTPTGDLLVSQPREGIVTLLEPDADGDGRSDGSQVLLRGYRRPHGLALRDGYLYVAEADSVGRLRYDAATRRPGRLERLVVGLPSGGNHWTRTLRFGPDGGLYVSVGSSCNVCVEEDPRRASILRFEPDGRGEEIYASGLRNAVDFAWHPATGELYATDNGRDLLGDDFPPDELNRVERGGFYGWPFANGRRVPDPDLGAMRPESVAASEVPVHEFRAHNAPLGIAFLHASSLPGYADAAAVALHGSWNRTRKDGYKVVSLHWRPDGSIEERDLLWGFENDGDVVGRPVSVAVGPDGAVYVSDDYGGSVFRVAPGEGPSVSPRPAVRAPESPQARPPAPKPDAGAVARGAELFARYRCLSCHDPASPVPGIVPRPLDGAGRRSLDELAAFLAAPTPPMPLFPLSAEQRRDLAAYLQDAYP